jgi:hypothetical protein
MSKIPDKSTFEKRLNTRSGRCLGARTPEMVFFNFSGVALVT